RLEDRPVVDLGELLDRDEGVSDRLLAEQRVLGRVERADADRGDVDELSAELLDAGPAEVVQQAAAALDLVERRVDPIAQLFGPLQRRLVEGLRGVLRDRQELAVAVALAIVVVAVVLAGAGLLRDLALDRVEVGGPE